MRIEEGMWLRYGVVIYDIIQIEGDRVYLQLRNYGNYAIAPNGKPFYTSITPQALHRLVEDDSAAILGESSRPTFEFGDDS